MINLEGYLDITRIRASGAKSLRDYVRQTLFGALDRLDLSLRELSQQLLPMYDIPYETLARYRSGSIPIPYQHIRVLNLYTRINESTFVPLTILSERDKFFLWKECCSLGIRPVSMPTTERDENAFIPPGEHDLDIMAMNFQQSLVCTRILKKFEDPQYDVLFPTA